MATFGGRLQHAWNAFLYGDSERGRKQSIDVGYSSWAPSGYYRGIAGGERTIINSIYTRMAMDVAAIDIYEARIDDNGNPIEKYKSGLNECLITEANIDQCGRAFLQDVAMQLLEEGHVCIVPTDTDLNPMDTESYDIKEMRTGIVRQWYPAHVQVNVYNERTGKREDVTLPKKQVAIVQNPLYAIMNEPNSTLKRLVSKLNLMDVCDNNATNNKFNMIIQLPYVIKSEARKQQAELRRAEIESQLVDSRYGIAYTDGTEKIQQLSRPIENNFLQQIQYLTDLLYEQLGITKEVLNGTANEQTMLNYYNHTIEPIAAMIADEMTRKFLTKTARTQNRRIVYMRDPFKLVPVNDIAEIADKFTRNEILSSNEIRCIIGFKPSDQEGANDLRNKNLYADGSSPSGNQNGTENSNGPIAESDEVTLADYENTLNKIQDIDDRIASASGNGSLKHYGEGQRLGTKGSGAYSNPYYDPDYQHEYYVNNKQKDHQGNSGNDVAEDITVDDNVEGEQNSYGDSMVQLNIKSNEKNSHAIINSYDDLVANRLNVVLNDKELNQPENKKFLEHKLETIKNDNKLYRQIIEERLENYKKNIVEQFEAMTDDDKKKYSKR